MTSCNGRYRLVHQSDGNLVVYNDGGIALWNANTSGVPATAMAMQADGNVVLYAGGIARWFTGTDGPNKGTSFVLQDDGNLVVYGQNGEAKWDRNVGTLGPITRRVLFSTTTGCTTAIEIGSATKEVVDLGQCVVSSTASGIQIMGGRYHLTYFALNFVPPSRP